MNPQLFSRLIWGLIFIAAGVVFLMRQAGVFTFDLDIGELFSKGWPVIIILFGLKGLLMSFGMKRSRGRNGSVLWNLFAIMLGGFFLLANLEVAGFTYDNMYKFIVPVILILIGFQMMLRGPKDHREKEGSRKEIAGSPSAGFDPQKDISDLTAPVHDGKKLPPLKPLPDIHLPGPGFDPPHKHHWWNHHRRDMIQRHNFIGDVHLGQDYWELRPLQVSHFIGDTVIDLTKANIPQGETDIEVAAFIGDVKLYVPNDMQVEVSVSSSVFIGDIRVMDRREGGLFRSMHLESPQYRDADKKIRVTVSMFIGDVIVEKVG